MARVVIIGGGLTGLATAYHFEKRGFFDYALFEKENVLGGLCRSVQQDGFTFDFTGHLLHVSEPFFETFLQNILDLSKFNTICRNSFIYSHNVFTRYPYQQNLFGLPQDVIIECIEGFVKKKRYQRYASFYAWVLGNFGAGIARHFFLPFQEKIFDYEIKKISASWTGRFVPQTSLQEILRGSLGDTKINGIGYNAQFLYPQQGGIQYWIDILAQNLRNLAFHKHEVTHVNMVEKYVVFSNGHQENYDILISTIPLDLLLEKLVEKSSTHFKSARKHLLCNYVINFNLGLARSQLTDKHWIYFPEKEYPFYRLGFPHNFAASMTPPACSSLYGEIAFTNKSESYMHKKLALALEKTKNLFQISPSQIITEKIIKIPHAYVLYTFWRERNLAKLLQALQQNNIYSIGRYGAWKYSSMQEAVLDGKKMAESITVIPASKTSYPSQSWPARQEKEF